MRHETRMKSQESPAAGAWQGEPAREMDRAPQLGTKNCGAKAAGSQFSQDWRQNQQNSIELL